MFSVSIGETMLGGRWRCARSSARCTRCGRRPGSAPSCAWRTFQDVGDGLFKTLNPTHAGRQVEVCALFRAVHALWVAAGQYSELCVEDVKDELFDIVRPAHPLRITAADLLVRARAAAS